MLSDNETMHLYMQRIGQYQLVTRGEEVELAAAVASGSEDARQKLIRSNLRLVVKIAHDFKGFGLPLLDLISEGNIGLMRAVEKFDPSKGAKLSSYAAWWIKQAMRRAVSNQTRTIRIPIQSASKIGRIKGAVTRLTERNRRDPTDAEVAVEANLTVRTVAGLRMAKTTTVSLNDPIQAGEDGELQSLIPDEKTVAPDNAMHDAELMTHMLTLVSHLDDRERAILTLRFGLNGEPPRTLEVVSQAIGRTRERVRQIQNQALEKLRTVLAGEELRQTAEA